MPILAAILLTTALSPQADPTTPDELRNWAKACDEHLIEGSEDSLRRIGKAVDKLTLKLTPDAQDAILRIAGTGLDRSLAETSLRALRDRAHWLLFRHQSKIDWSMISRSALGLPKLADIMTDHVAEHRQDDENRRVHPGQRIAAIRLLGHAKKPAFRATIESCLTARDPRIRLAATEALGHLRHKSSISITARALALERHPVVAQALVRTAERILSGAELHIHPDRIQRVSHAALRALGQAGWRTDLAVVRFLRRYPCIEAIPTLIDHLEEPTPDKRDKLRQAVNENASPFLREEILHSLRRLTGAIMPENSKADWLAFWEKEQANIKLPKFGLERRFTPRTTSGFFGIPVTGRGLCFVIDTSSSMKVGCEYGKTTTKRRRRGSKSRLEVAAEQTLQAVQAMNSESRYHLITFNSDALLWNENPVPPIPKSFRALTNILSKLRPKGGTNLYNALRLALDVERQVYGQLTKNDIDAIFVLSDGEPQNSLESLLKMVEAANKYQKIRIHTVFCGESTGGAKLLQELAKETGGAFVQVR